MTGFEQETQPDGERMASDDVLAHLQRLEEELTQKEPEPPEDSEELPTIVAGSEQPLAQEYRKDTVEIILAQVENAEGEPESFAIIKSFVVPEEEVRNKGRLYREVVEEIKVTYRLSHIPDAAFVKVLGYKMKDGEYRLIMPYYEGRTLDFQVTKNGPPNKGQLRSLVSRIGGAVLEMHKRKMFHRDIWGKNIFFEEDGNYDTAVLADLGTCSRVTDQLIGTAIYMNDASLRGYSSNEFRDVFAFSAMIYHTVSNDAQPFGEVHKLLGQRMHYIEDMSLDQDYWAKELGVPKESFVEDGLDWRMGAVREILNQYLRTPREYVPLTAEMVNPSLVPALGRINEIFGDVFSQEGTKRYFQFELVHSDLLQALDIPEEPTEMHESPPPTQPEEGTGTGGFWRKKFNDFREGFRGQKK